MHISFSPNQVQVPIPVRASGKSAEEKSLASSLPLDTVANLPSNWKDIDTDEVILPASKPPTLERPIVFVHGFNGSAERWDKMMEWLSSDDSGNRSGGVINAGQFDDLDPKANMFSLRLSRPYNSVEKNTAELKETVEAVLKATGASEVDLVVHSLGGLNSRAYLQDKDEKVNKLIMLGTPNHGSQLANLELWMREKFNYPVLPPVDDPEVRRVLEQLSVDKTDRNGEPQNPWLHSLNDDWANHKQGADIMIVAGAGTPTLTGGPGVTVFGDGVVTRRSARMDGVENKTVWFKTHGGLQNSTKVMEAIGEFLIGRSLGGDENLFDRPEDAVKAAKLLGRESTGESSDSKRASLAEVRRAVRLPLLDPAFQIGLGMGVLSALLGGPKESLPLVEVAVNSQNSQTDVHANYQIDMAREENPLRGAGSVAGNTFAEVANLREGTLHWDSALGLQSSGLTMEIGEDEQSILMKGRLGGVPTDLKLGLMHDDQGRISGLETVGTFNGDPYQMRSTIDLERLASGRPLHHSDMHVTGTVNGEQLDRTYQLDIHKEGGALQLRAQHGEQGVDEQSVGVVVTVTDR